MLARSRSGGRLRRRRRGVGTCAGGECWGGGGGGPPAPPRAGGGGGGGAGRAQPPAGGGRGAPRRGGGARPPPPPPPPPPPARRRAVWWVVTAVPPRTGGGGKPSRAPSPRRTAVSLEALQAAGDESTAYPQRRQGSISVTVGTRRPCPGGTHGADRAARDPPPRFPGRSGVVEDVARLPGLLPGHRCSDAVDDAVERACGEVHGVEVARADPRGAGHLERLRGVLSAGRRRAWNRGWRASPPGTTVRARSTTMRHRPPRRLPPPPSQVTPREPRWAAGTRTW